MATQPDYRTIQIDHNNKKVSGTFLLSGDMITVFHGSKIRSTQLGGALPEILARLMLSEILREKDAS